LGYSPENGIFLLGTISPVIPAQAGIQ